MPGDNSNNLTSIPLPSNGGSYDPSTQYGANQMDNGAPFVQHGSGNAFSPTQVDNSGNANDQTGGKMSTQQGQIYGGMYDQAQGMSGYFNQLASGYNQTAPTIGDASQLGVAQNYYQGLMNGDAGYAAKQYQQSQDQAIAAQMAMANSARGGAASLAGAQRAATQGAGAQMATAANQAGQIAAQEEQMGAQGMQGIGQLELQRLSNNAQLQQNNQQQINQMQQALYGMGEQEQGLGLSTQQAYMANLLAAEGINTQQSQFNTQLGVQGAAAGLQTIGAIGSAAVSDERFKTDINPQGTGGISSTASPSLSSSMGAGLGGSAGITSLYSPSNSSGADRFNHALNTQPQAQKPDNAPAVGLGAGIGAASGAVSGAASGGPIGAAIGGAGGAITGGLGAAAHSDPHNEDLKIANTATQAGIGAAGGAAAGSAFGPWGTGIGALVGGAAGLIKGLMT